MTVNKILQSKKNANCILDLEEALLSNDEDGVLSSMDTFQQLFTELYKRNMIQVSPDLGANEEKYRLWLLQRKSDLFANLLIYLNNDSEKLQEKSLEVLMTLVQLEGINKDTWEFPKELFSKIVHELLSPDIDQQVNLDRFEKYTSYDDIMMYSLKAILDIVNGMDEVTDIFLTNLFYLLHTIKFPEEFSKESNTFLLQDAIKTPFHLQEKLFRKLFSSAWRWFLKYQLPFPILKRVLLILHKRVIPHLQNPCLLTDFLTDSYKQGGIISLLSLNSLYFLMDKYNVEYPDFFLKLYSLTNAEIANGKYGARFFYLTDLFLSSTHLPAYTVAAFAKKLSRIALSSRTDSILRILTVVINLLIRYKSLSVLIHRESSTEYSQDPFDIEATDPAQSNALESSFWEIQTLQNHINPDVSRKAKLIKHELPATELELSAVLDVSMDSLYKKERKRKFSEVPLAVLKPCRFS